MDYQFKTSIAIVGFLALSALLQCSETRADERTKCSRDCARPPAVKSGAASKAEDTFAFNASAVPASNVKAKDSDPKAAGSTFKFDPNAVPKH